MKKVELKQVELPGQKDKDGNTVVMDYGMQIAAIIRVPQDRQGGMGVDEMRSSIKILDALDGADGFVEFEDADYDFLKRKVLGTKYQLASKELLQFIEDVTTAE